MECWTIGTAVIVCTLITDILSFVNVSKDVMHSFGLKAIKTPYPKIQLKMPRINTTFRTCSLSTRNVTADREANRVKWIVERIVPICHGVNPL